MQIDHLPKESGIYKITCTANGKFYIGSSVNVYRRAHEHVRALLKDTHHSVLLQRAFNKYGVDNIEVTLLQTCDKEDLITVEQYYLDSLSPKLNICKTAGNTLGVKLTAEMRANLSRLYKGNTLRLGKKHSLESRQKMSESHKGRPTWNKGKKLSSDHIEKLRKSHIGLPSNRIGTKHSLESRQKMSASSKGQPSPNKGKKASDETRRKLSESHKGQISWCLGKKLSSEHIENLRISHTGKKQSPETIAKRNATRAANKQKRLATEAARRLESQDD